MLLKKISPKSLAKKLAFFAQTTCKNCDNNIGFWEKRHFFRRKLEKIAENYDHNIDPRIETALQARLKVVCIYVMSCTWVCT
jgi:hypothetical protein